MRNYSGGFRSFLRRVGERISHFMNGRYGFDGYGKFLLAVAIVLILISGLFAKFTYVYIALTILAWGTLIYGYSRILSRKLGKRAAENYKYYAVINRIKGIFGYGVDRSVRYFKCPGCRKKVRVPRNRGKIEITCRNCGTRFVRYTGRRK